MEMLNNESKQTMKELEAVGISSNCAMVLSALFDRKKMSSSEIRRMLGVRDYKCNEIMSYLTSIKWIGFVTSSSGKKGRPENVYYLKVSKEYILKDAYEKACNIELVERLEYLVPVFLYIFVNKKVTKASIIEHLSIKDSQVDNVLDELKRRKWIKLSKLFNVEYIYCECIVSLTDIKKYYEEEYSKLKKKRTM